MARDFPEPISITVPLRTTWEESWQLLDDTGAPMPLDGYQFRMQVRDKRTGALLLEIGSLGLGAFATITDELGRIDFTIPAAIVGALSPTNRKLAARWDAEIYIPAGPGVEEYVVPLLRGSASFQPRVTQLPVLP